MWAGRFGRRRAVESHFPSRLHYSQPIRGDFAASGDDHPDDFAVADSSETARSAVALDLPRLAAHLLRLNVTAKDASGSLPQG